MIQAVTFEVTAFIFFIFPVFIQIVLPIFFIIHFLFVTLHPLKRVQYYNIIFL